MTVFERLRMPSLGGATGWLNSEPLGPAELREHVVLVDFWTLTCINWLRTEPYIRAWSQVYRDDGLIVIGVHTPEFSFEHEVDRVRQATKERAIDYPVAPSTWADWARGYWTAALRPQALLVVTRGFRIARPQSSPTRRAGSGIRGNGRATARVHYRPGPS
jgi:thiol-disulfide isomerase/thioredoxin